MTYINLILILCQCTVAGYTRSIYYRLATQWLRGVQSLVWFATSLSGATLSLATMLSLVKSSSHTTLCKYDMSISIYCLLITYTCVLFEFHMRTFILKLRSFSHSLKSILTTLIWKVLSCCVTIFTYTWRYYLARSILGTTRNWKQ